MDIDNTAVVGVRPTSALLHGGLPRNILEPVLRWVALNTPALIDYWDRVADTAEFVGRLRHVAEH